MKNYVLQHKWEILCGTAVYACIALLVFFGVIPKLYGDESPQWIGRSIIFLFAQIPGKIIGMMVGSLLMMALFIVVPLSGKDIDSPEIAERSNQLIFGSASVIEHSIVNILLWLATIICFILINIIYKKLFKK